MITQHGSQRTVFVFPGLGVVIKIPISIVGLISNYKFRRMPRQSTRSFWWCVRGTGLDIYKAVQVNWHEFTYYHQSRHPILQPTYFSFFGLLNIQRYGLPFVMQCSEDYQGEMYLQMMALTDDGMRDCGGDPHHFRDPLNFGVEDGKLRIHDYGDPKTQKVLDKFGDVIYEKYDSERNYRWC